MADLCTIISLALRCIWDLADLLKDLFCFEVDVTVLLRLGSAAGTVGASHCA